MEPRLLEHHNLPVVLVDNADDIVPVLNKHFSRFATSSQLPAPCPSALMAHATASAPGRILSKEETATLGTIFSSIKELERGSRTEESRALIHDFLPKATAREVIEFWEDEWLA